MEFIQEEIEPKTLILADIKENQYFIYRCPYSKTWVNELCVKISNYNGKNVAVQDRIFNFRSGMMRLDRHVEVRRAVPTKIHFRLMSE